MTNHRRAGRNVSAIELESLGKTAARLSETSGLSLTEAAMRTLEPEGLNAEQIRRAVEHCNIAAVNSKYAKLAGYDRIVHIDGGPADPLQVIDALNASATAPGAQISALEYSSGPVYEKRAQVYAEEPVYADVPGLRQKLSSAHDELVDMCGGLEFDMEMKFAELREGALRAAREGASLCDLTLAWSQVDPTIAKVAAQQLRSEIPWGEKTAGRRMITVHPAITRFEAFSKVASEFARAKEARRSVETELARVSGFLAGQVS